MRAILIDPVAKTVSEVEYNEPYTEIYRLLSDEANNLNVNSFDVVDIEGNSIFVDDEGLLKSPRYFFRWEDYDQPLSGRGLVIGCNEEGVSVATRLTLEYVRSKVTFCELSVKGFVTSKACLDDTFIYKSTPIFGESNEE